MSAIAGARKARALRSRKQIALSIPGHRIHESRGSEVVYRTSSEPRARLIALGGVPGGHPDRGVALDLGNQGLDAKRGDEWVGDPVEPNGTRRHVFGRIVGSGHASGAGETPDEWRLGWRSGDAPPDTQMFEHPQVGVVLGVQPEVSYLVSAGQLRSNVGVGLAVEGGYNASRFVNFADEVWSRIYVSFQVDPKGDLFYAVELVPEATYYLTGGLAVFGGTGLAYTHVSASDPSSSAASSASSSSFGGSSFGLEARVGADLALTEDWNLRMAANYRQGLNSVDLTNDAGQTLHAGTLSALQASVSAGYTF